MYALLIYIVIVKQKELHLLTFMGSLLSLVVAQSTILPFHALAIRRGLDRFGYLYDCTAILSVDEQSCLNHRILLAVMLSLVYNQGTAIVNLNGRLVSPSPPPQLLATKKEPKSHCKFRIRGSNRGPKTSSHEQDGMLVVKQINV
jgi:hypothetical protein